MLLRRLLAGGHKGVEERFQRPEIARSHDAVKVETQREQRFHFRFRSFDRRPSHRPARPTRRFRHLRDYGYVVASENAMRQDVRHPRPIGDGFCMTARADTPASCFLRPLPHTRGCSTAGLLSLRNI
jgi:hypothetical protein